jgi:hypothetical protein
MLVRALAGLAGVGIAIALVAAALRLLKRLEEAAATAGVTDAA